MGWFDDVRKSWELFSARWPLFLCVGLLFILLPAFLAEGFGGWYAGKTGADALLLQYTAHQQEILQIVQEHLASQQELSTLEDDLSTLRATQTTLQQQLAPYFRVVFVLQVLSGLFGLFGCFVYIRLFLSPSLALPSIYKEARRTYGSFLGLILCMFGIAFILLVALLVVAAPLVVLTQQISEGARVVSLIFLFVVTLLITGYVFLPLQLAPVLFVKDALGPFLALERSWALIKGKRWRFAGRLVGFGLLLLCAALFFGVISYGLQLSSLVFPGVLWSLVTQIVFSIIGMPLFMGYLVHTVKTFAK